MQDLFAFNSATQDSECIQGNRNLCGVRGHCHGKHHVEKCWIILTHLLWAVHDGQVPKELHQAYTHTNTHI